MFLMQLYAVFAVDLMSQRLLAYFGILVLQIKRKPHIEEHKKKLKGIMVEAMRNLESTLPLKWKTMVNVLLKPLIINNYK